MHVPNTRICHLLTVTCLVCWALVMTGPVGAAPLLLQNNQGQEEEITTPEDVKLETKDGVLLVATYFAGPKSKETPCVILVHDWSGNRTKLYPFAEYLQKELKCSVLVPDLRGHGESTQVQGSEKDIAQSSFKKKEVASTLKDLEQCKRFLMAKNNEGELNIELLSMVAVGKTSVLAVEWCNNDWLLWKTTPGGLKQGQDVKFLCLINPNEKVKGISMKQGLKSPLMTGKGMAPLPLQIIWSQKNSTSLAQSKMIYEAISKPRNKGGESMLTMTKMPDSRESATGLISSPDIRDSVFKAVADDFKTRVLDNSDLLGWQNRSKK